MSDQPTVVGGAVLRKNYQTGEVTVLSADPVIRVTGGLLGSDLEPWVWDGDVLTLDTAGTYRYRQLRPDPQDTRVLIFGRI